MTKMTKRERFEQLANVIAGANISEEAKAEMLAFIAHEQELLAKKSSKSGQTKTQKTNETLKVEMREALENIGKPVTVSEFNNSGFIGYKFSKGHKYFRILRKWIYKDNIKTFKRRNNYWHLSIIIRRFL